MSKRNKKKNPRHHHSAPFVRDCAMESLIDLLLALDGWDGESELGPSGVFAGGRFALISSNLPSSRHSEANADREGQ